MWYLLAFFASSAIPATYIKIELALGVELTMRVFGSNLTTNTF